VECEELVAGCNQENYADKAQAVEKRWPNGFELVKGGEQRTESPLESLARIAPDKPVAVVITD
jgi:2-C-methyl-D-erythritol 4-phosphate cytidylyltransferase